MLKLITLRASDMANQLNMSSKELSKHLKRLSPGPKKSRNRDGIFYQITEEQFMTLKRRELPVGVISKELLEMARKHIQTRKRQLFDELVCKLTPVFIDDSSKLTATLDAAQAHEDALNRADATVKALLQERFDDRQGAGLRKALAEEYGE